MQLADMRRILERIASEHEDELRQHLGIPPFTVPPWLEELVARDIGSIPIAMYRQLETFIADMMPRFTIDVDGELYVFTASNASILDGCVSFGGGKLGTIPSFKSTYYFYVGQTVYSLLNSLDKDLKSGEIERQLKSQIARLR